jgi:predicted transglutaminase-like cysteine proteinase
LTQRAWAKMVEINARVNATIAPRTDLEMWGREEIWSYPVKYGDCEDYVLQKRHELIQAGFHTSNLLITVVLQPNGDGHAVLTVRTDRGDFVLDNLVSKVWTGATPVTAISSANPRPMPASGWISSTTVRNIVAGNF